MSKIIVVAGTGPLRLRTLQGEGCFKPGISTDGVGAKVRDEARAFSESVHDTTDLDGIVYHYRLRKQTYIAIYDRAGLQRPTALIPALKTLKTRLI